MDTIIKIGELAPRFRLNDLNGEVHTPEDFPGWITVLNFWSAECDWCKRVDEELVDLVDTWKDRVKVYWIASNENESRELIERTVTERKLPNVLLDTNHPVADLYGAQTTPHFFVLDGRRTLRYQGAWDDITFRNRTATQVYVPMVINALISGEAPPVTSTPAYGCMLVRFPS